MSIDIGPLVSIGIPVFNGERYLNDALESVLQQTHKNLEVIVCDNGSSDGTVQIARTFARLDPRVKVHCSPENLGAAKNFNWTVELARGVYFKWLAHDDVLKPTYIERCVARLESAPDDVILCYTDVAYMDEAGAPLPTRRKADLRDDRLNFARLICLPPKFCPALVFGVVRLDALRKTRGIGGFIMSDLVTVAELRILGPFVRVAEPLFLQRLFPRTDRMRRSTLQGEAAWFDPRNTRKYLFPNGRIMLEYVRSIWRVAPAARRPGLLLASLLYLPASGRRAVRVSIWRGWSRLSTVLMTGSRRGAIAIRAWTLLSGLRHLRKDLLRAALAGPWPGPSSKAAQFCAGRLARRNDETSDGLLRDWLECDWKVKREAAATVTAGLQDRFAQHPSRKEDEPGHPVESAGALRDDSCAHRADLPSPRT